MRSLACLLLFCATARADQVFVLRDLANGLETSTNEKLASTPVSPASTFKIPNALIGLDTGVITDEHFTLKWDGKKRDIAAWNHDQDLASALKNSVVWYFQEVARRIGKERMHEHVFAFHYGNEDTCCAIDRFWLDGNLLVTPHQQVDFLSQLALGKTPATPAHVALVRRLLTLETGADYVIQGKTGTAKGINWLVGWLVSRGHTYAYALLVTGAEVSREARLPMVHAELVRAHLI